MKTVEDMLALVKAADKEAIKACEKRQNSLVKPPGSLGRLESLSIRLAGITGKVHNEIKDTELLVFCADNGVYEEGVASTPQIVTLQQTVNLTRGLTGAAVLAKNGGTRLTVVDVGVKGTIRESRVLNRKIAEGTANIVQGPAMSRDQVEEALRIGFDLAFASTADAIGIGEMGIANTTTSSAVLSCLLSLDPKLVTGRGAGLGDRAFSHKIEVIRRALAVNQPDSKNPLEVLQKVGGLDLAAMCGAFLGAAAARKPVVIDGLISAVAALCAYRCKPDVVDYLIPSHASYEIGYKKAMEAMGLTPFLFLDMRLGEGSGCCLVFPILQAACAIINEMATFEESSVSDRYIEELDLRKKEKFRVDLSREEEDD